jgi:hypothetical protein
LSIEVTSEENLLVAHRVQVVSEALTSHIGVKFLDHEAKGSILVLVGATVDEKDLLEEEATNLGVGHVSSEAIKDWSESLAEESLAPVLGVKSEFLALLEKDFNLITNLSVLEVALY